MTRVRERHCANNDDSGSEGNAVGQSFEWLHAVLLERMRPDARDGIYQTKVSTTPSYRLVVERELVGGECAYLGLRAFQNLLRSGETLSEADRARLLALHASTGRSTFPRSPNACCGWHTTAVDDPKLSDEILDAVATAVAQS